MYAQRRRGDINWSAVGASTPLKPVVQEHLRHVYTTLACTLAASVAGVFFQSFLPIGGFLTFLGLLGLIFLVHTAPKEQVSLRFGYLLGIGVLQGVNIAPLVNHVLDIDPAIVSTALLGTASMFACFSIGAIYSNRRSMMYLGAFLASALSSLMWISFFNVFFFHSSIGTNIALYGGLVIFSGYVVFDTQLMIEKANHGDLDFIAHALELFVDFVAIFVRLLIILSKDKKKN